MFLSWFQLEQSYPSSEYPAQGPRPGFTVRTMLTKHWCFSHWQGGLSLNQEPLHPPDSASEQMHEELGGNTAGAADQNRPMEQSIPGSIIAHIQTGGSWLGSVDCPLKMGRTPISRWWAIVLRITCFSWAPLLSLSQVLFLSLSPFHYNNNYYNLPIIIIAVLVSYRQ